MSGWFYLFGILCVSNFAMACGQISTGAFGVTTVFNLGMTLVMLGFAVKEYK